MLQQQIAAAPTLTCWNGMGDRHGRNPAGVRVLDANGPRTHLQIMAGSTWMEHSRDAHHCKQARAKAGSEVRLKLADVEYIRQRSAWLKEE